MDIARVSTKCSLVIKEIFRANDLNHFSAQAHSSVERAGLLGGVKLRSVPADENNQMRGATLEKVIRKDIEDGFIPFFIVATLGTTNSCAFDCLDEIGAVGNDYGTWVHVDAAYAGTLK